MDLDEIKRGQHSFMKSRIIVEDFGKIRYAELEMKPMMMFIGDNNSGKSYLMSLLWGLSSNSRQILTCLTPEIKENALYRECEAYILKKLTSEDNMDQVDHLDHIWFDKFWRLLNTCIAQNKDAFVSDIFNKEMHIGRLELHAEMDHTIDISVENTVYTYKYKSRTERYEKLMWVNIVGGNGLGMFINEELLRDPGKYVETVLKIFLEYWSEHFVLEDNAVFLPSSRTGFVLSKNILTNQVYDSSFNKFSNTLQEEPSYFTKPVISFLKLLNSIGEKEYKSNGLKQIAEFMEREILHGEVEIQKTLSTSFLYKPEKSEQEIQMYLASAVVTEIAPLYLLCKYSHRISQLFIEEPEMCMHPQFQVLVARVLVRMRHEGIPVMATTHSDIMIQHINNMLRVKKSDRRQELMERFHLEEADLLDDDDIGLYQFVCKDGSESEVLELKAGELGFETPTFSNIFEKMLDLTYEI